MLLFLPVCHLDSIIGHKNSSVFCSKCTKGSLYLYIPRCFSNGDTRYKCHWDRVCTQVALLHLDRMPSNSFHRQNAAENSRSPKGNSLKKKQTGNTVLATPLTVLMGLDFLGKFLASLASVFSSVKLT